MASIIIAGNALVVKSGYTLDEIARVEKHRPAVLALYDKDGKPVFKVGTTGGKGSINAFGASFGRVSPDEGKNAVITMEIPDGVRDAEKYAVEAVGTAIINLNKVEEKIPDAIAEIDAEIDTVKESIVVI